MNLLKINKWDKALVNDTYRNYILIPFLLNYINIKNKYIDILDIGSGTGYIAKKIIQSHITKNIKTYSLLDSDLNMINFSKKNLNKKSNKIIYINKDFKKFKSIKKYDLIFLSFTLLEFKIDSLLCTKLTKKLKKGGSLIIFLPDVLQDIYKMKRQPELLNKYINNELEFSKNSNKSNIKFPFIVNRIENLISLFLSKNLCLYNLVSNSYLNKNSYILHFKEFK